MHNGAGLGEISKRRVVVRIIGPLVVFVGSVHPALAHAPIKGIGAFYNGMLHPLLVPTHLLVLVSLGLLIGQHAPQASRTGWPVFVLALLGGLGLGFTHATGVPEPGLLAIALTAGLLVALAYPFAAPALAVLAAAGGTAVGMDSMPDTGGTRETWLLLAGTAIGTTLVFSYAGGLAATLDRPWQRIGVRIAGSWAAAAAAMVLALALAGSPKGV